MIRRIAKGIGFTKFVQIDFAQVDCERPLNLAVEERSDKSTKKPKSMHRMF